MRPPQVLFPPTNGHKPSVVLVNWGRHRVGLAVDKIIGQQEIVAAHPLQGEGADQHRRHGERIADIVLGRISSISLVGKVTRRRSTATSRSVNSCASCSTILPV